MNGLHAVVTTRAFYAGDLIGFTSSLLITLVLLVLTLRAAKLPGTPIANIVFAVCALLWSAGGLAQAAVSASGASRKSSLALAALAIQFTAATAFPLPILALWRPLAVLPWQKKASRILMIAACLSTAVIAIVLWARVWGASPLGVSTLKDITAYNAMWVLLAGAIISLRRSTTPRPVFFASLAIVSAVTGAAVTLTMARNAPDGPLAGWLVFLGVHLVLLVVLCAFFLFARFRYADVFIRYGVRILLSGTWAAVLAVVVQSALLVHIARQASSPPAVHVFLVILTANGLLLSFTFVDERLSRLVNRWLFRPPDYRSATRQLVHKLRQLDSDTEIGNAVEEAARVPLELRGARLLGLEQAPAQAWPAGIHEGELVEVEHADRSREGLPLRDVEVMIPVSTAGRVSHVLLIAPGSTRPALVMTDLNYLGTIASQAGARLDALHRERESADRQSREAVLLQQVTEAELRALRAQINPHFLFNSLNTIADLIVRDPARAETMTLRLAGVFRHVLAHSSRPLTSIRDEMEFLRTYLYIEEARFGDRLQVDFDVAPEVLHEQIPSLILQPIVENALRHGLGPKPGPGHLWISGRAVGPDIRLSVEDDGMGPQWSGRPRTTFVSESEGQGLGLANVTERLRTLYQDRASVTLEARQAGGTSVVLLIPRVTP